MLIVVQLTAVHVGDRVRRRARVEQRPRDLDRVAGRALAITLHAVGGDIVQQRRAMHRRIEMRHAGRSRMNERRVSGDGRRESAPISPSMTASTADSKRAVGEPGRLDRDDVRLERGPVEEVVAAGHRQLRIGLGERRRLDVVVRQLPGQPRNLARRGNEDGDGEADRAPTPRRPARTPGALAPEPRSLPAARGAAVASAP